MGIKVGKGEGFINVGGGEGLKISAPPSRPSMGPLFRNHAKGHDEPFVHPELRLGIFKVIEEHDNHIECFGYDPNGMSRVHRTVNVAKPWLLLAEEWDGATVTLGDLEVSYEYDKSVAGKRIAVATIDEREVRETQLITPDYFEGDMLVCVQCRETAVYDGISAYAKDPGTLEGVDQVSDARGRLTWVDLNFSGRCWAVDVSKNAETAEDE